VKKDDADIGRRGINVGSKKDLEQLDRIVEANRISLVDVIDSTFMFKEAEEAFAYLKSAVHTGKVVIKIEKN
jgi:threonine dehydrogenase-like Zn-dependent dehydrogenase